MLAQANTNNVRRVGVLREALTNSDTFRRFMVGHRAKNLMRDEEELWWMLAHEMENEAQPRRSVVKRLHGAIVSSRQRREWAELQRMLDSATSGA